MSQISQSHLLPVSRRADVAFERGEGVWLIATNGDRYLDFGSGIAVNGARPLPSASGQGDDRAAQKVWHVSNLFKIPDGERLAAAAVRGELRRRRVLHQLRRRGDRVRDQDGAQIPLRQAASRSAIRIITFDGSFHGRTLATIAAGGQQKYLEGFGPPVEGFDQVAFGDLEAVKKAIGPQTAAIMIEPVQGEGGVRAGAAAVPARPCASSATSTACC